MPNAHVSARMILFFPFQKEVRTTTLLQNLSPEPAQFHVGDGTCTVLMTLQEVHNKNAMITDEKERNFCMINDLLYKATKQRRCVYPFFNGDPQIKLTGANS
jgi:hypothetical protein